MITDHAFAINIRTDYYSAARASMINAAEIAVKNALNHLPIGLQNYKSKEFKATLNEISRVANNYPSLFQDNLIMLANDYHKLRKKHDSTRTWDDKVLNGVNKFFVAYVSRKGNMMKFKTIIRQIFAIATEPIGHSARRAVVGRGQRENHEDPDWLKSMGGNTDYAFFNEVCHYLADIPGVNPLAYDVVGHYFFELVVKLFYELHEFMPTKEKTLTKANNNISFKHSSHNNKHHRYVNPLPPSKENKQKKKLKKKKDLQDTVLPEPSVPCHFCGRFGVKLLICGRCNNVQYCSKDCQKNHWKSHKQDCSL